MAKKEVKEVFNIEFLGYKKAEVDELVNALSERVETLSKDVAFLKKELSKNKKEDEPLLKPVKETSLKKQLH